MTDRTESRLRDLGLVLLGAALVKSERQRVLDSVAVGALSRELEDLIDGFRTKRLDRVRHWLLARGVDVAKTGDAIAAVADVVNGEAKVRRLRASLAEVPLAAQIEDRSALVERLKKLLEDLER